MTNNSDNILVQTEKLYVFNVGQNYDALAVNEPDTPADVEYDEETIRDPVTEAEIHGQDGYGWYVDSDLAEQVARRLNFNDQFGTTIFWNRGDRGLVSLEPRDQTNSSVAWSAPGGQTSSTSVSSWRTEPRRTSNRS